MSTMNDGPPARLAARLRELREHEWPDVTVTQAQLARALGAQSSVASATLSTWENVNKPKTPSTARLTAYARFFATRRSMEGGKPRLLAVEDLDAVERERYEELREELLALHAALDGTGPVIGRRQLLSFDDSGPIVVVCPEAPEASRGPLADASDPNHTRLHRFADADALLEVFGHIRALNPVRPVLHKLPSDTGKIDLQNHLVLLGGVGWNATLRRIQAALVDKLPIEQVEDPALDTGDVFRVRDEESGELRTHFPVSEEFDGVTELTEDIGLIARLKNPYNTARTLTICNGVHSTGVLGAVLALTDETVRPGNEEYLFERFPKGELALLIKVPVISGDALAPDLQNPDGRVFEWSPAEG